MSTSTLSSKSRTIIIDNGSQQCSQLNGQQQLSHNNESLTEQQLERLKEKIELSKEELIHMTNHNQFSSKVFSLNYEAKKLIEQNKIQQAIIYLNEAEKILQYAASSGKSIERKTILQVLHNQACCYQILWDLEKCSNYIEALIFNFNSELKVDSFQSPPSDIHMSSSKKSLNASYSNRVETIKMEKKLQLAKYYLLYCAINSQLKNNQGALVAAKKASEIANKVIQQYSEIYNQQKQLNTSSIESLQSFVLPLLDQIPKMTASISIHKVDQLLCLVRHYIKRYNSKCLPNNLSSKNLPNNTKAYQKYKNFSIGNIMQLQPVGQSHYNHNIQQLNEGCANQENERISEQRIIDKLIVFSICQFTMSTELRYIALSNAKGDKDLSHTMVEFKQSQTYHLLSILLVAMYMPFDLIYMEHIISSYHSHYHTLLLSNGLGDVTELEESQINKIKESILFTSKRISIQSSRSKQEDAKKCSTTNQSTSSLVVSFHQQDDSKQQSTIKNRNQNKNSHKKQQNQNSPHRDQELLSEPQNNLFDQYYYCKKNTEPDQELAYHSKTENHEHSKIKYLKSKSKDKQNLKNHLKNQLKTSTNKRKPQSRSKLNTEEVFQSTNKPHQKVQRKTKSKTKDFIRFDSNPSTIIIHTESQQQSIYHMKSQIVPQMAHSPIVIPEIYSKIIQKPKLRHSKSKQNRIKIDSNKNKENSQHQNQYFSKCNFTKKVQSQYHKPQLMDQNGKLKNKNKSRSNKKRIEMKKKEQDEIKFEYFHIHDQNILNKNKSPTTKKSNPTHAKKSVSKSKKQRLSSKSLSKTLSPNRLSKKSHLISQVSKLPSQLSKDKRSRMTQGFETGRSTISSAIYNNRRSISGKKSQRHTIHNVGSGNRLGTQEQRTMKASHFDKYYL